MTWKRDHVVPLVKITLNKNLRALTYAALHELVFVQSHLLLLLSVLQCHSPVHPAPTLNYQ